jgi:hypothetical protein
VATRHGAIQRHEGRHLALADLGPHVTLLVPVEARWQCGCRGRHGDGEERLLTPRHLCFRWELNHSQMRSSERSAQTFKQARKQERFPFLTTHSPPKTFFFWSKIIAQQFV